MKKLKKSVIMVLINILKIFKKKTIDKVNNQCYNKYIIKKESGD